MHGVGDLKLGDGRLVLILVMQTPPVEDFLAVRFGVDGQAGRDAVVGFFLGAFDGEHGGKGGGAEGTHEGEGGLAMGDLAGIPLGKVGVEGVDKGVQVGGGGGGGGGAGVGCCR